MQGEHYALDTYYYYDDETDLISSVATTIGGSRRINYTYDDEDRVVTKSMTTITPYVNSYTYNDDGLIATDTVTAKNGTFAYGYTYDDNGNITEITKNGTVQQRYIYDETDQLVREDNLDINKSIVYEYDNCGNILNKKEYAFTTGELGTATDTITYTYNDTGWKDQLTSYDGQSITYDAIGNPTTYRGITMTWNGRKLMSYTKGDDVITYKYDGNGLRTQKIINGVKHDYYYDENNQLIYEIKEGVYELYYKYDADGNLFSITRYRYSDGAKHVFYATTNTRGDVIELRSASGAIYATYTYDSWGKCISVKNSSGAACSVNTVAVQNSIRYRGYVYDYETGLYYLQSRYYDAETGRFLNADDAEYIGYSGGQLSYNAFAYCENEPVGRVDDSGNASSKKKKSKYYITIYTYNEIGKWDLGHIDFSLDGKIYSYGTINNDADPKHDNTISNKLFGRVPGYVMVGSVKNWQNYLKNHSDSSKVVQDEVRINLTKSEYKKLKKYINSFLNKTEHDFTSKKIEYYEVKKGTYKKYSFTKANCSTFVRDALYACMPKYVKSAAYRISCNGYKSIYIPDNVFTLAKLIGGIK